MRLRTRKGKQAEIRSPLERPEVFAGALRDPNESGSLSVTLSVWSDQIVMHNDDVELGEWPRHRVRIIPMDSTTFEFIAEGDRLLFIPDDRVAFSAVTTETVRATTPAKAEQKPRPKAPKTERPPAARKQARTKKRRTSAKAVKPAKTSTEKTNTKKTAVEPAPSQQASSTPASTSGGSSPSAASAGAPPAAAPTARKGRMRIGRKKKSDTVSASTSRAESSNVRPPGQADESAEASSERKPSRRPGITMKRTTTPTTREGKPATAADRSAGSTQVKTKRWIGLIDLVRTHSISGLDRVPVDVSLRGSEHQHTWDHRAAAPSGPSKHICTICGKLRF